MGTIWAPAGGSARDKTKGRDAGEAASVPGALRGRFPLGAFDAKLPSQAVAEMASRRVKELELMSLGGEPFYLATVGSRETRIVPVTGEVMVEFPRDRIIEIVRKTIGSTNLAELRVMDEYDSYYLDRHHEKPLPVIVAELNDAAKTRYYIDPKTAG